MCHLATVVGGKAANLSRLSSVHRVPPGFCLSTDAFVRWSGATGLNVPSDLLRGVADAYRALAQRCGVPEPSVAVRSSAVDEDGSTASFAGQHETYLNIVGAQAVAEAVVRCWASARSERALEYRRNQGLSSQDAKLAVLVQQLVPADTSAVVFSANPVSGNRGEVLITASWGLGESVVGGTVTPDTFVVRKDNLAVTQRSLGDKRRMTVLAPGGTEEVDVPRFLRSQFALTDDQAREAARLAMSLEETMGWAADVECAFHDGKLYLLQCRPITTLDQKT
jgi:pyruvate,water dikinase